MPKIFYTSDLHLNHVKIGEPGYEPRRFETFGGLEGMNDALISNWNAIVSQEDTVRVVGDLAMGLHENIPPVVQRLNGKVELISGNHDFRPKSKRNMLSKLVAEFVREKVVDLPGIGPVLLKHTPSEEKAIEYGIQICGHVHHWWTERFVESNGKFGIMVNVGVDVRNWKPVPEEKLIEIVNRAIKLQKLMSGTKFWKVIQNRSEGVTITHDKESDVIKIRMLPPYPTLKSKIDETSAWLATNLKNDEVESFEISNWSKQ